MPKNKTPAGGCHFRVRYEIDVFENSYNEAALKVMQIMRDPESIKPVFEIRAVKARRKVITIDCETLSCDAYGNRTGEIDVATD